jgi:hypothetical protein
LKLGRLKRGGGDHQVGDAVRGMYRAILAGWNARGAFALPFAEDGE